MWACRHKLFRLVILNASSLIRVGVIHVCSHSRDGYPKPITYSTIGKFVWPVGIDVDFLGGLGNFFQRLGNNFQLTLWQCAEDREVRNRVSMCLRRRVFLSQTIHAALQTRVGQECQRVSVLLFWKEVLAPSLYE